MARALSAMFLPVSLCAAAETLALGEMPLRATNFKPYHGYAGALQHVSGSVSVGRAEVGTLVLFYDFSGVDEACPADSSQTANVCGIQIHAGTSCDEDTGFHFDNDAMTQSDPWLHVRYTTVDEQTTGRNVQVPSGSTLAELKNHTVVVHDSSGDRIACAPLSQLNETGAALVPSLSKYPDYHGVLVVQGKVEIAQEGVGHGASQTLRFNLTGVDPECVANFTGDANACGIHIHAGTSCADASQLGGHFYDSATLLTDPWTAIQYVAGAAGTATGVTTPVVTGAAISSVVGKALVVYDHTGAKVACAVIQAKKTTDANAAVTGLAGSASSPRWWALAASAALARAAL